MIICNTIGQFESRNLVQTTQRTTQLKATQFQQQAQHLFNMAALQENINQENLAPQATKVMANLKATKPEYIQQQQIVFQIKKLNDSAIVPTRGSAFSAGYDLSSAEEATVPARGKACVDTGLAIAVPAGHYGRVAPRSGLAVKKFIDTGAGVIDEDYRGPLKVVLFNFSDEDFKVSPGDRIAQLILERISTPEIQVVEELSTTGRGAGGFGSTGVAAAPAKQTDQNSPNSVEDSQTDAPGEKRTPEDTQEAGVAKQQRTE